MDRIIRCHYCKMLGHKANKCNKNNRLQASINREVALGQNSIKQEIILVDGDYEITIKLVNEGPSIIVNIAKNSRITVHRIFKI